MSATTDSGGFDRVDARPHVAARRAAESASLSDLARKQSVLLETMRALTSTLVLEDVLALAARSAAEVMGVFSADINVYSPAENTMTEVAYWALEVTPEDEEYAGSSISLDERPDYYPFVDHPVVIERQLDDPGFTEQEREIAARWGEKSALVAPLVYGDRLIGLMGCMEKRRVRRFSDEDKELFRLLAVPAALAIHNAQMFQQEEMRNRRLVNLLGAAQKVAAALDRDELARRVCEAAPGLFPTRACSAAVRFIADEDGPAAARDVSPAAPLPPDPLAAAALESGVLVASPEGEVPVRLVVPLLCQGAAVGYVELTDRGRVAFSPEESEVLEILVTQTETALENSRLYREIERQAISDDLTGLANQRYFRERLRQEVSRSRRLATSFSLLIVDLDDFKLVNDRLGHQAGDDVLQGFAALLAGQLREGVDLAARYGGDEFAVLLPDVGEAGTGEAGKVAAAAVAERVRLSLKDCELTAGDACVALTLSAGVAGFPGDATDDDGLFNAADKALYLAKRLGKDRVEVFD
jgi:diguanylate cyclase (GGDEF)-like protein